VVNLAVALVLHNYVPGWEATKRQGSMSYGLLGLGICGVGMVFFWGLDMIIKKPITYLAAFGKNPFLTYMICAVPAEVLDQLDMVDLGLGPWGNCITAVILLVLTSVIVVPMYKRNKIWSTEKATIVFIIVTVILAGLLIGLGVIEI
jgi:hypothetical protein